MVKLLSLFESISNAKSNAEVHALFEEANKTMPDNTLGHSVPVYYLDGKSGEMMVRYPVNGNLNLTPLGMNSAI